MKTINNIFLSVLFCSLISCSSIKKDAALENYLQTEVIDPTKEYLLIKEKVTNVAVLRILFGGDSINEFYDKNLPIDSNRSKLLNETDWKNIYNKYKNDTITKFWRSKNFPNLKLELQEKKGLYNTKFLDKHDNNEKRIIWISEPIYYQRKKLLLFYISESNTYQSIKKEPRVIIMKKIKGKWEVVDNVYDYILY